MLEKLIAILMALTPWHGDVETHPERSDRMVTIARAIEAASGGDRQLALLLVVQGEAETHFARHVHEGNCRPWECDKGQSVSPWQVRLGPWLPREHWEAMRGSSLEATTAAASYTARSLRMGVRLCRGLPGAFSVAAKGGCGWPGAEARVRRYHQLARYLWRVAKHAPDLLAQ